jgi:hypothetical protein
VSAKLLTDNVHAGDQTVVEDLTGSNTGVDRLPGQLGDPLILTIFQVACDLAVAPFVPPQASIIAESIRSRQFGFRHSAQKA